MGVGSIVFPPPINVWCGALAGVGALLLFGIPENKADPVAEKLKELAEKIKELEKKVLRRFDEMKVFISENKFSMEVIGEVETLKKFLHNVFDVKNKKRIENFRAASNQKTPLNIAYILSSLLAQKSTNPLMMALEKSHDEKEETLKTWEYTITTIASDLIFIEALSVGLLKNGNEYDLNRLISEYYHILDVIDQIKEKYDVGAWSRFKKEFPKFSGELYRFGFNNGNRAEVVKKRLEEICPHDSFYVCVYESGEFEKDYYYHVARPYNLVEANNVQDHKYSVFVYRSHRQ